jgi:hypothetical protein
VVETSSQHINGKPERLADLELASDNRRLSAQSTEKTPTENFECNNPITPLMVAAVLFIYMQF